MRMKSLLATGTIVLASAVALTACGGGSSSSGGDGEKAEVEAVVTKLTTAATKGDAAAFCKMFEPSRLAAWIGEKRCIRIFKPALKQAPKDGLKVESIDVDGDTATVKLASGETKLQKIDGKWYLETPDIGVPEAQTD